MKRPIRESIVRYATALVLLGARWFLSRVGGSVTVVEAEQPSLTTRPATDRPMLNLGRGLYAEWCVCGCPPMGKFAVIETSSGRLIAMHLECLYGAASG